MAIMMTEESNEVTSCRTNDILQGNKSKAPPKGSIYRRIRGEHIFLMWNFHIFVVREKFCLYFGLLEKRTTNKKLHLVELTSKISHLKETKSHENLPT